eukprot:6057424-Alexandrium_andersonii.AAC.1
MTVARTLARALELTLVTDPSVDSCARYLSRVRQWALAQSLAWGKDSRDRDEEGGGGDIDGAHR